MIIRICNYFHVIGSAKRPRRFKPPLELFARIDITIREEESHIVSLFLQTRNTCARARSATSMQ